MNGQSSSCQSCGSLESERVLDLGYQPLCNEFWPADEPARPQTFYPLCLWQCLQCSLVQLDHVIPTAEAFGEQYTYLTGSSRSLIDYYAKLASTLVKQFDLKPGDAVVEIGSNDGTFLKAFQEFGISVLGVEGASAAVAVAGENGVATIGEFFGSGMASQIQDRLPTGSKIRLILAMNVLAHTDNINEFLAEVVTLMDEDTIFISQSHWLIELIRKFEFDTIYHEHLRYYTLGSLNGLFQRHGLNIFDAEAIDFYGGSILAHASINPDKASQQSPSMVSILEQETSVDVNQSLKDMKSKIIANKSLLLNMLVDLHASGKRVIGIGAPMKASTFLNFYGITDDLIEYLAEVNELKVGTVVPGVRIPVLHEEILFREPPDYAMLLSWNMAGFIIPKYREMGYQGKFILPVPELEIVE